MEAATTILAKFPPVEVEQLDELLTAVDVTLPADARAACDRITKEIRYPME